MDTNIFHRFQAALIDMDGVLYDSMPGHTLAWKRMIEGLGIECSREEFYLYEGMTGVATVNLLFERAYGHGCSREEAMRLYEIKSRYFKEWGEAPMMPGAGLMLMGLKEGGMKRVLVTGSAQKNLLERLDRDYPEIFDEDKRVTALDVTRGKPDPEPYLQGARKAGVAPSQAMVIENAPLGVRAGKAAGCFTVAVTTGPIPREEFERVGADMIFGSMQDFAAFIESQLFAYKILKHIESLQPDKIFVLLDRNVKHLHSLDFSFADSVMLVNGGEECKSTSELCKVWEWLGDEGATRESVLINVGGGCVSDLGGFAAATFKRGIRYVNVPTTVLGAADAAIGGKTGINFMGLKNEVGAFALPEAVVFLPFLLRTLPGRERLSGLAEVVKMAAINDAGLYRRLLDGDAMADEPLMNEGVIHAARCKEEVVSLDPKEKGLRRILNFGHTAGHAFEEYARESGRTLTHGEAVAHGILVAMKLSEKFAGLSADVAEDYKLRILNRYFSPLPFGSESADRLVELMRHDKKNRGDEIAFVLLRELGNPLEAVSVPAGDIKDVLLKL